MPVCVYTNMCEGACRGQKEMDALEFELQMVLSCTDMGAGIQMQVLCLSSIHS